MYIDRQITQKLMDYSKLFPVIYLTGPRQSGKSTLIKRLFKEHRYVNLEEKDVREFAATDPRGFLDSLGERAAIDEAQRVPDLFSYLQTRVDENDEPGMYILSGSQNFLMLESISQSLAGRVGILSLLPFSGPELMAAGKRNDDTYSWLFSGQYPRQVLRGIEPTDFFPNYIKTYIDRDIRLHSGVKNISKFESFIRICAINSGNPINLSQIGNAIGVDSRTVASWIDILEESYITFRLKPYVKNQTLRFSKVPKLFFYDTGLLCNLLGIETAKDLFASKKRGTIFENGVITEYYKKIYNSGGFPLNNTYFWRDSSHRNKEIDFIVENSEKLELYEIKSSRTADSKYADNLILFEKNAEGQVCEKAVIYDGPHRTTLKGTPFINHRDWLNGYI